MDDRISVVEMVRADGQSPFADWFNSLDESYAAKVVTAQVKMTLGNDANTKSLGAGVWEYRIHWGPGLRIYFGWDERTLIVLLGGGTKKRQQRDIDRAKALWREFQDKKQTS